jgi:phospholipase/carboxylesterase
MTGMFKDPASGLDFIAVGDTKTPKRMIVVLHGTGDNAEGIQPLGELFANLPGTLVLIPNGPVPLSAILPPEQIAATKAANPDADLDKARNWTGASKTKVVDEETMIQALDEIMTEPVHQLNTLIDGQRDQYGLKDKDIVVYGFSAGGLMALHASIQRDEPVAGVIAHSGHFLGAYEAVSTPKVLMIYGDQELAHPQVRQMFLGSAEALRMLGLDVEEHACTNLGHGLNQEALETAAKFMKSAFDVKEEAPKRAPRTLDPPKP